MRKVLFIINSLHQKRSGKDISYLISRYLDRDQFTYTIYQTAYAGHEGVLTRQNREAYEIIVAAGGDGTVNEIASVLAGSSSLIGIIPIGSGNGLARTIYGRLPSVRYSIQIINGMYNKFIDMGRIDGKPFFNMAGIGFDAEVAHSYNQKKNRGFFSYLWTVAELYFKYPCREFEILYESKSHKVNAFLVSIANSSQWGYGAHICPGADPSDGLLGITILRRFPKWFIPVLVWKLFNGTIDKSCFVQVIKTKCLEIRSPGQINGHLDGSPVIFHDSINVDLVTNAIRVISG